MKYVKIKISSCPVQRTVHIQSRLHTPTLLVACRRRPLPIAILGSALEQRRDQQLRQKQTFIHEIIEITVPVKEQSQ
ncbi:MAG: hypothetical protein ABJM43_06760 [Paracoccaceae bacterium]